jgi:segregation and condensation protein B
MSAEELPPAADVEEPAAVPTVDELSAAKEKSRVEEAEDDVPPNDPDDDDEDDDDDGDDADDDSDDDDDDSDDDDSDDDSDDDEEEEDEDDGNDDDDDDSEDSEEEEAEGLAAEAIESPAETASAREVIDGSDASAEEDRDRANISNQEVADLEDGNESANSEGGEIEELVAEAVEAPTTVVAAPLPPITDVVSSDHAQHLRLLEALLFAGTQALDDKELADRLPNDADLPRLLADLAELYANRGINLVKVAGGYAFRTAPDLSEKLKIERPVTRKLSRASVETLAIIAYHQPVTRAEIEQVRGVGLSKGTLDLLFEQNWIKPMGRRRAPGKPVTWGTTDFFLEHFGLPSLDDLPGHEEMRAAGLLDPRAQPPIFRPEEPDLPLEPTEDEAVEPLAVEEQGASRATEPQ